MIAPPAHLVLDAQDKSADTRALREDHCAAWLKCGCGWDRAAGGGQFRMVEGALCSFLQDVFDCMIVRVEIMFIEA